MANWKLDEGNVIDYSPTGDDIDLFSQKVKRCIEHLYALVQILHSNGSTMGLTEDDTVPGEIRANLADGCLYVRSADNKQWFLLGELNNYFGIKPETIGAVANGGGVNTLYAGVEGAMSDLKSSNLQTNDAYFATDTFRFYIWTGSSWQIFLSRNFGEMLNYEKYCVAKSEVGYSGANKILRLDKENGKANVDITGSPSKIFDKEIDFQDLRDGHSIVYNADKDKWVNLPNDELKRKDLTYIGEAEKIVAVGSDGWIRGKFSGETDSIGDIEIDLAGLEGGQVLAYDFVTKTWRPVKKDVFTEEDVTTTGEAGKLVKVAADGKIHGELKGSASEFADMSVDKTGVKEGYVLAFDTDTGNLKFVKKDVFTEDDVTTTGEPGKLARVDEDGYIRGKIFGNANEVGNIKVKTVGIKDGEVLAYDAKTDSFLPVEKDSIPEKYSTTTGEANKLVVVGDDGAIHADIRGKTDHIGCKKVKFTNLKDGDILVYHTSAGIFKNQAPSFVGAGKSLILKDGNKLLGDYNGGETVEINVAKVIEDSSTSYVNHLLRLIENLYLALDYADLDFGGYDALTTEVFKGGVSDLDNTVAVVTQTIINDDSINVTSFDNLIIGAFYQLTDGTYLQNVRIKKMRIGDDGTLRVILTTKVTKPFAMGATYLKRATGTIGAGYISGDGVYFITKPIPLNTKMSRAHVSVKHENILDADISAQIAFIPNPQFVKGEVIGIGNDAQQTVILKNTNKVCLHNFKVYFDGVETTSYVVNPDAGKITFTAADGVIVSADYFYNWEYETFVEMEKTGIYPDKNNPDRATTQFLYHAAEENLTGSFAVLKFTLKQLSGGETNFVLGTGTGAAQGFKLPHQALPTSIYVSPSTAVYNYNENFNTLIVTTASAGETVKVSYNWKGKEFKIDSWSGIFNE